MVSVMAIVTAKGTREVFPNIVVVVPLKFVVISPLGVLVSPNRLVLLGLVLVSSWSKIIIVSVFSLLYGIVQMMRWIIHIHLFKILILLNGRVLNKITPACGCPCGEGMGWGEPGNGKCVLFCGNYP
jgi:hypothetical protein